ncbi:MAG: hypothetical protein OXK76_10205 [Gammaproteobacteria bacterium]|nr:hypothetical protein [Gammaproteobacteria bacterium]
MAIPRKHLRHLALGTLNELREVGVAGDWRVRFADARVRVEMVADVACR